MTSIYCSKFSLYLHNWIKHQGHECDGNDNQLKKLLIVRQILLVSISGSLLRTVWRIYILWGCNNVILLMSQQFTDYHKVAEGYGGKGFLLSNPSTEEIDKTLSQAQEVARDGTAVLINALIGKTDFREGSISVWHISLCLLDNFTWEVII